MKIMNIRKVMPVDSTTKVTHDMKDHEKVLKEEYGRIESYLSTAYVKSKGFNPIEEKLVDTYLDPFMNNNTREFKA